ncbi:MAG: MFS transporter [Acidimicrobiales bacterium]
MDARADLPPVDWDHAVGHPDRRRILAMMCGCLIMVVAGVSSLNVAIPTIVSDLDASQTEQLWILDAYALVFAGLLLPAGALGDRFGRRRALLTGLAIFGTASLVATRVGDPLQLIALRAAMGSGAALIMPATLSIITTVFPPVERGKAIATWAGMSAAGGALGPLASGLLLERFWWGSIFFINTPIVVLVVIGVLRFVPEVTATREPEPLDPVGSILSIVGLTSVVLAIIEGPEWGWTSGRTLGVATVGVLVLVGFVAWELRSSDPMLDPRLFRIRRFAIGAATITLAFLVLFGSFYIFTLYLQFARGHSALGAAVRMLPFPVTMILVAPRSPKIVARIGDRATVAVGFGLQTFGFVLASQFDLTTPYLYMAATFSCLALGMAMMMPPTTAAIVASLPESKAGVGSAVNDTTREVGGAVGIAMLGSLLSTGYRDAFGDRLGAGAEALPETARELAGDSIAGAAVVAERLGGDAAQALADAAASAYIEGLGLAFTVAAVIAFASAVGVTTFYPRGSDDMPSDLDLTVPREARR